MNEVMKRKEDEMGIFSKKKVEQAVPAEPETPTIEHTTEEEIVWVNLTENMLRVELDGDSASVDRAEIKESGDRIRVVHGGIIIAEIGKRGKAYKEILPHVGRTARRISITAKAGEYGDYYRMRLKFEENVTTITV